MKIMKSVQLFIDQLMPKSASSQMPNYIKQLTDFGIKWVFVELTNYCNMHCVFCPSDKLSRARKSMDFDMFVRVIDEIVLLNPPNPISLHVLGEPLIHPDFFKCLDYCNSKGLKVYLFTNCLITMNKIEGICQRNNIDALVLSIQTPTPESFTLRGVNTSYKDYWESIQNVVEYVVKHDANKKMRIEIHIANTTNLPFDDWSVMRDNESAITVIKNMARQLKMFQAKKDGGEYDSQSIDNLVDEDFKSVPKDFYDKRELEYWGYEVLSNVFIRIKHFGSFGASENILPSNISIKENQTQSACEMANTNLCVLSDGTITMCCTDTEGESRIGHMNENGVYMALNSELRKKILNDVTMLSVCRRCLGEFISAA